MSELIREGGWGAICALLLGAIGVIGGIIALSIVPVSRKTAHVVGVVVLALSFLAPAVGLLGMVRRRHALDEEAASNTVQPGKAAHARREGWRESRAAPRAGFYACLGPLLLGSIAAFLGARRKLEETVLPRSFAGVTAGLAFLTGLGAFAASKGPLPPELSPGVTRLLDARGEISNVSGGGLGAGCFDLEQTVAELYWHSDDRSEWPRHFDAEVRTVLPDYDALGAQCIRSRIGYASQNDLLTSPLLVDDVQKNTIAAWRGPAVWSTSYQSQWEPHVEPLPDGGGAAANVTFGVPTIRGRLAVVVFERIVDQHPDRFRRCYAEGLVRSATLRGRITETITIRSNGSVESTAHDADLPDPAVVECVDRAFEALSFPERFGEGSVTVQVSVVFGS